jgi:hypothetical protein
MNRYTTQELRDIISQAEAEINRRDELPHVICNKGGMFFKNLTFKKANKTSIIHEDAEGNEYLTRTTRFERVNGQQKYKERLAITRNW